MTTVIDSPIATQSLVGEGEAEGTDRNQFSSFAGDVPSCHDIQVAFSSQEITF